MAKISTVAIWLLAILLFQTGCGGQEPPLIKALDGPRVLGDWVPSGNRQVFDAENLYDLVNGQADGFFAYSFEQVAVQNYEHEGESLRLEIWQLAAPVDAYGLFSSYRAGDPIAVGQGGDGDPGRRLDFWQDRFFVRIFAPQPLPQERIKAFAEAVADALPEGGQRPDLVDRLPRDGLLERSDLFFHEEISIQNSLWLGGQNLLGLSTETDGVLALYQVEAGTAYLLLVQYPEAVGAQSGLAELQSASIPDLVAGWVRGDLLGAVFGVASKTEAHSLLRDALKAE